MSKAIGNIVELIFLQLAVSNGIVVSIPYGDNSKYDFITDRNGINRIQVKSTSRLDKSYRNNKYSLLCASGLKQKIPYTKKEVDFIAAYVSPEKAWYIIPISEINGIRVNLYPHRSVNNKYEQWRDRWDLL